MGERASAPTTEADAALAQALATIGILATEVGPRRPTSRAERHAAELVAGRLRERGVDARTEPFLGYSSFAEPFGLIAGLALLSGAIPRRRPLARAAIAAAASTALVTEGGFVHTPLSGLLSRRPSQNLVATIEPAGETERTLCLVSHLDTSRSGLLFHPALGRLLNAWISAQSAAVLAVAVEPLLSRLPGGRALPAGARTVVAAGLALLAERELRGVDVPGANDNASGVAVTTRLAAGLVEAPLATTRVILLATGCEESGLLGAQAFLRANDTSGWLFLNFDSVGGPATLRYLEHEGIVRNWPADPSLVRIAAALSARRPELGLEPADTPIGLTYDTTAVLARGGRALTFVAGDRGVIPNYHRPSDTADNVDAGNIAAALETGREMIAAIDRGEADRA